MDDYFRKWKRSEGKWLNEAIVEASIYLPGIDDMMPTHASILSMTKTKNECVVVADFGEFGSMTKSELSEYAKNKKLSVVEVLEILNSMKSAAESQEFNSLISDQKSF